MFLNKRAKKVIYLKLPCSFCLTPKYLVGNEKQAIMTIPIADKLTLIHLTKLDVLMDLTNFNQLFLPKYRHVRRF